MGVTIGREEGDLRVLRITGLLRKSEWDSALATEAEHWRPETRVKVLVIVENFKGWERGVDWGDMDFFVEHEHQIEKSAIVADPQLETDLLMFAGAGFRRAPVKFFSANQLALARAWLG
jgi:hypothetical protein